MQKIKTHTSSGFRRILYTLLAVILVVGLFPGLTVASNSAEEAYAAGDTSGYLHYGSQIPYGGYSTRDFRIDFSADGEYFGSQQAYCAQASLDTPSSGTYNMEAFVGDTDEHMKWGAALWYGYGGPGFQAGVDAGLWPDTYYNGEAWTDETYMLMTHIVVANRYGHDGESAYGEVSEGLRQWVEYYIDGYCTKAHDGYQYGDLINPDAVTYKIGQMEFALDGGENVWPSGLTGYLMYTGYNSVYTPGNASQMIMTYSYVPYGEAGLTKSSANTSITDGNSCYSLAGAEYGIYSNYECTEYIASLYTDEWGNTSTVELQAGTYWMKEISAPMGYAIDNDVHECVVNAGETTYVSVADTPLSDPMGIIIKKATNGQDEDNTTPTAGASFEGAEFTVTFFEDFLSEETATSGAVAPTRTWVFATDPEGIINIEYGDDYYVRGDELYRNEVGQCVYPLGTYLVQETKEPTGYNINDTVYYMQCVDDENNGHMTGSCLTFGILSAEQPTLYVPDAAERNDLRFTKAYGDTQQRIAHCAFLITSYDENDNIVEQHVVNTDQNGIFDSRNEYLPHDYNTNGNDSLWYRGDDGILYLSDESAFDWEAGCWFCGQSDPDEGNEPNENRGAFQYGKYVLEEIRCSANEGYQLISPNTFYMNDFMSMVFDLGTFDDLNSNPPIISTSAHDGDDFDKYVTADTESVIVDTLEYSNVVPGTEYTTTWTLWTLGTNFDPDDPAAGAQEIASGTKVFTPTETNGSLDIYIDLDSTAFVGQTLAISETLIGGGDSVSHNGQLLSSAQRVSVTAPNFSTVATDVADGDKEISRDADVCVKDTVSYNNVRVGLDGYTLVGELVVNDNGERGETVATAETEFSPVNSSGTVDVYFDFDASSLDDGTELVAVMSLYRNGVELAFANDINDSNETVKVVAPNIGTTARDGVDGDNIVATDTETVIVDTVKYSGLTPGKEYTVTGTLMCKMLVEDGIETDDEGNVCAFADAIETDDYILYFYNEIDNTYTVLVDRDGITFELTDEVVSADEETITGNSVPVMIWMSEDEADALGLELAKTYEEYEGVYLDANGEEVHAEATFIPDDTYGTVDVTFVFDSSDTPSGTDIVVFENLYRNGVELAVHADIDDEGQTVTTDEPRIGTTATDEVDGDHEISADDVVTIIDTVDYENLVVGKEYTVCGTLMVQSTGEALCDSEGNPVVGETTFIPQHTNGSVEVTFTFDASLLEGESLVVFEDLMRDGILVAYHTDINDEGQTVDVASPYIHTRATDTVDGDKRVVADVDAGITDTIEYGNLVAGEEVTLLGILMDKSTGLPLLVNNSEGSVDEASLQAFIDAVQKALATDDEQESASGTLNYEILVNDEGEEYYYFPDGFNGFQYWMKSASNGYYENVTSTGEQVSADDVAVEVSADEFEAYVSGSNSETVEGEETFTLPIILDNDALKAVFDEYSDIVEHLSIATFTFTPETTSGTVDVYFDFDASDLAGTDAVVYEFLVRNDELIATHADIDDEGQTVEIVESVIGTNARDKADGDKTIAPLAGQVVVDTVDYTDLIPGVEYELRGELVNKSTGEVVTVNGVPVTSTTLFTPNTADGTVEMEFTFDASDLENLDLVVFEYLYKNDILVAEHADINDDAQTVHVSEAEAVVPGSVKEDTTGTATGAGLDKTGQTTGFASLVILAMAGLAALVWYIRRKRKLDIAASDISSGAAV